MNAEKEVRLAALKLAVKVELEHSGLQAQMPSPLRIIQDAEYYAQYINEGSR